MDMLRTCYKAKMKTIIGGSATDVVWYRTPEGAPVFSGTTCFRSRMWCEPKENDEIGEQSAGRECCGRLFLDWFNGRKPLAASTGPHPCGTDAVAVTGAGPADPTFMTNADGSAPCCTPFDPCAHAVLQVLVTGVTGTGNARWNNRYFPLRKLGDCSWARSQAYANYPSEFPYPEVLDCSIVPAGPAPDAVFMLSFNSTWYSRPYVNGPVGLYTRGNVGEGNMPLTMTVQDGPFVSPQPFPVSTTFHIAAGTGFPSGVILAWTDTDLNHLETWWGTTWYALPFVAGVGQTVVIMNCAIGQDAVLNFRPLSGGTSASYVGPVGVSGGTLALVSSGGTCPWNGGVWPPTVTLS